MNLALFFEGTGQGVRGMRTNVTVTFEGCVQDAAQHLHLEAGPGTHHGYHLRGHVAGRDWKKIFASARRWFEGEYALYSTPTPTFYTSPKVFLFGFSRGALLARHFAAWLDKLGIAVEYMGLWDTVDATPGLAVSEICPLNVRYARHAVARDEARRFFAYVPLRGREVKKRGEGEERRPLVSQVEERLFPGVHSDVGGLYDDDHTLADAARAWIVQPAAERGLVFKSDYDLQGPADLTNAIHHNSLRLASNLWGLLKPVKRVFKAL